MSSLDNAQPLLHPSTHSQKSGIYPHCKKINNNCVRVHLPWTREVEHFLLLIEVHVLNLYLHIVLVMLDQGWWEEVSIESH